MSAFLSKMEQAVLDVQLNSSVQIEEPSNKAIPNFIRINIHGKLSKLPSTTNNRVLGKDRKTGKPTIRKNVQQMAYDEALTRLFHHARKQGSVFQLDRFGKVLVHVLLADSCSRIDPHNVDKFVCDWLQKIEVLKNDRNAICISMMKQDFHGLPTATKEFREYSTVTAILIDTHLGKALNALALLSLRGVQN